MLGLTSAVACFRGPRFPDHGAFHEALWRQLSQVSRLDRAPWDGAVSSDPDSSSFCFSFGGTALFVIGLSPTSADPVRRFEYPTLVFNPNHQFDMLRRLGRLERWKSVVRRRADAIRGYPNEMLADHGQAPGWRQYSMMPGVETCPFRRSAVDPGPARSVDRDRCEEAQAFASFTAFADSSPCIGARSVVRRGQLSFVLLDEMGSRAATIGLSDHLRRFVAAAPSDRSMALVAR